MSEELKIRLMKPDERIQKFAQAVKTMIDTKKATIHADLKINCEKDEKLVSERIKKLEEKYNCRFVPEVKIEALLWPEEVAAMQEKQKLAVKEALKKEAEKNNKA